MDLFPIKSLQQIAFEEFHRDNPHVYKRLVDYANKVLATGRKRYGIATLYEVLRYRTDLQTTGKEFKLNNNHKAYYARMMMQLGDIPGGFFELRVARADEEEVETA